MKRLIIHILLAGMLSVFGVAEESGDGKPPAAIQFKKAQQLLSMADEARDREKHIDAIKLYREALITYIKLSKHYPDWQPGVTQFRMVYCNNQLEALLKKADDKAIAAIIASDRTNTIEVSEVPVVQAAARQSDTTPTVSKARIPAIKTEAKILLEKADIAAARGLLLQGLQADPDDRNMRMLMGMAHCGEHQFENALYVMEPLIQEDSSNAVARIILGTAYFGLGKLPEAAKQMQEALLLNPKSAEAHYNLAQIRLCENPPNTVLARNHYKTAIQLGAKPDNNLNFLLTITSP